MVEKLNDQSKQLEKDMHAIRGSLNGVVDAVKKRAEAHAAKTEPKICLAN